VANGAAVLFKLKPDTSPEHLQHWSELGNQMVGKIPGEEECHDQSNEEV
jgi:hypothetical protein